MLIRGERTSYKLEALHRWGGLIRERGRGGWSETIRVVDLEEREAYFLLSIEKKKKDVSIALRKLSKTYLTTWLSTLTELTTYIQFQC